MVVASRAYTTLLISALHHAMKALALARSGGDRVKVLMLPLLRDSKAGGFRTVGIRLDKIQRHSL